MFFVLSIPSLLPYYHCDQLNKSKYSQNTYTISIPYLGQRLPSGLRYCISFVRTETTRAKFWLLFNAYAATFMCVFSLRLYWILSVIGALTIAWLYRIGPLGRESYYMNIIYNCLVIIKILWILIYNRNLSHYKNLLIRR